MTPDKLKTYFDTSSAIRLFRADYWPFIVCFLHERFKRARQITVVHSELLPALSAYQERLHEAGFDAMKDSLMFTSAIGRLLRIVGFVAPSTPVRAKPRTS